MFYCFWGGRCEFLWLLWDDFQNFAGQTIDARIYCAYFNYRKNDALYFLHAYSSLGFDTPEGLDGAQRDLEVRFGQTKI